MLIKHPDIFAWTHEDMLGIDPAIIQRHLSVDPRARGVRQKRRSFSLEKNAAIALEVERLLAAGFIQEVHHLDWLSNMVLVKKYNGKWRMCVDFKD